MVLPERDLTLVKNRFPCGFDENGMSAAHGNSALEHTELKLSWEEIEKIIRSQVESGTYMDSTEAYMVDYYERKRITNQLYFSIGIPLVSFPKGWR